MRASECSRDLDIGAKARLISVPLTEIAESTGPISHVRNIHTENLEITRHFQ